MKFQEIAVVLIAIVALWVLPTIGYGQAPTKELLQTIKKLEARIAELEAKSSQRTTSAETGTPNPTSSFLRAECIIHAGFRLRSVTRFLLCARFSQVG
jgi:hypothetical protein